MNKPGGNAVTKAGRDRKTNVDGQFAFEGLDRVIHEKARLGILTSLAGEETGLLFNDLKQLCLLTDGNLNRHLNVLVEADMVQVRKSGRGSRRQSLYRLTKHGRQAFIGYLEVLEGVVRQAQTSVAETGSRPDAGGRNWRGAATL